MIDPLRQEISSLATTIVVKVGTRVLTRADGVLNLDRIQSLAGELNALAAGGRRVALVSSGAVGAGMGQLGIKRRPTDLAQLQAVAAIGQTYLVQAYDQALRVHGRHAAQVLLTAQDLEQRLGYLHVRNTLLTLLQLGAVPIINENDTVSVEELQSTFGDNDRLASLVANLLQAPLLVILSDVEGLYDRDPRDAGAQVIPTVERIDDAVFELVRDRATGLSKGGMASKLHAARACTHSGENVIIASGREPGSLAAIARGELVGTLFVAQGEARQARKRWIGYSVKPRGSLTLDDGACRALRELGRSLLPAGVREIEGDFSAGDVVALRDAQGREFARGLCNYPAAEVRRIKGLRTAQIQQVLGHCPYDEVIHRDNMTLTG